MTPDPVRLPNDAAVIVMASDPDGTEPLVYAWSVASGPADATFANNGTHSAYSTRASFTESGGYVLRVAVYDGIHTTTSDVPVTVLPPDNLPTQAQTNLANLRGTAEAGVVSVLVDGVEALDPETMTWSADVTLPAGGRTVEVVITTESSGTVQKQIVIGAE